RRVTRTGARLVAARRHRALVARVGAGRAGGGGRAHGGSGRARGSRAGGGLGVPDVHLLVAGGRVVIARDGRHGAGGQQSTPGRVRAGFGAAGTGAGDELVALADRERVALLVGLRAP